LTFTPTGRLRFNHAMSETSDIERLWRLGDLVSPMAVRVAATLRLSDHIAAGAATLPDLAERTDSHPETLGRLMRHLVAIGVYSRTGERYSLTGVGEAMREGHTGNRGPLMLDLTSAVGRAHLAAVRLLESVRSGGPAYPLVHGRGFWDDLSSNVELGAGFDELMGSDGDPGPVVGLYDWTRIRHVVDVGGGMGTTLAFLLRTNPNMRGTLVELPGPAQRARQQFEEEGLSARATVLTGSFFGTLPAGADIYWLSAIIHDWGDADAVAILHRCADAAGRTGRVLIAESLLDPTQDLAGMSAFDLFMLVCCGGRERTLEEYTALGKQAGLSVLSVTGSAWPSLVEFIVD